MEFGEQVKRIRQSLNLSQMELAEKLSVSFSTVNRWENGHSTPSKLAIKSFRQFCENTGIDINADNEKVL
jgi:transcriptional regulator with XRE-family HTH domain